ncbi:Uncharacterised protein [Serratia rubidaea]|uniref:Uncharacterized protein n=1 Tax=Serratia rubidaea TaxID=61652 RepID=A0A4U9HNJ5_SERRU|nr:Uncharacterised protein [Serratia rubidaea]
MTGGHYYGLAGYMMVLGVISAVGLWLMPETAPRRDSRSIRTGTTDRPSGGRIYPPAVAQ